MVLKKTSPYFKIGIILISIILVGILQFKFSNNYVNKLDYTFNVIKLLKTNQLQLQKIQFSSNIKESEKSKYNKEIQSSADLIDYSFSVLKNGGEFSNTESKYKLRKPNENEEKQINDLRKTWNKYHLLLIQLYNDNNDDVLLTLLNTNLSKLLKKQKSVISFYSKEHKTYNLAFYIINIISTFFYILVSIILFLFIKNNFIKPVKSIETIIEDISEGNNIKEEFSSEYYNAILKSIAKLEVKTKERYNFANQLVNNNLDIEFKSYNKNNLLEYSLIKLKNKLKENIEENAKRVEDEKQRQWFANGQAKFNDILRESSETINTLASASLKNIVKFLDAAQGGFFILKEDSENKFLELTSSFAYDRMKALNKTIPIGEGLIGMCAIEGNTIWLNNVPDDYMEIESGLGEAPPTNILIIPLKNDNNILGAIEIASFKEFKQNEVKFIENIAEDIASTLETTKITDKTASLLEESQRKSLELAMRDAEMSEKITELKELQKQTSKSETEMTSLILAVDKILFKVETSMTGKISFANKLLLNKINYDIKGKKIYEIINEQDNKKIHDIIKKVENNETVQIDLNFETDKKSIIKTTAIFSPIKNEAGRISKILILDKNISEINELAKENSILTTEIEKQQLHLLNINEEKENSIQKLKNDTVGLKKQLKIHTEREKSINSKHENRIDKKYKEWISSF